MEDFDRDPLSNRDKNLVMMRSLTNYVMGIFLVGAGCFFMFPIDATREFLSKYDDALIKTFGVICWIYGLFRIYRGYKKNYFKD
jgi:hypothetical protein